jgi:aspartyl protease family protein
MIGCIAVLPTSAAAQSVALAGILGSKALLVVDGAAPRSLAAGERIGALRLLSVGREDVLVEIAGREQRLRLGDAPVRQAAQNAADPAPKLVLFADSRGHFIDQGQINGQSMHYLIDTGASSVAIGRAEAERLGLPFLQGQRVQMGTANGSASGWRLRLDSVRIGGLEVRGVEAVVTPQPMPFVLLGNSFLSEFQMTRQGEKMVLEKRR